MESSSVQHKDDTSNISQQKTDADTSSKEPAMPDALKTEETTEIQGAGDAPAKEQATQVDVKSDEVTATKVEGNPSSTEPAINDATKAEATTEIKAEGDASSNKEPAMQSDVKSNEVAEAKVEGTPLSTETAINDATKAEATTETKAEGDASAREQATQVDVKSDEVSATKVEGDHSSTESTIQDDAKSKEAENIATTTEADKTTEKLQPLPPVATQAEVQPSSSLTEEPIPPTPDASKELGDVRELTSKLKTTMQTISLAKNSLIQQNG